MQIRNFSIARQAGGRGRGTLIKKKIKFFLIYKEIQNAVAKSYMNNELLIYG
jgi:hypothetical protein